MISVGRSRRRGFVNERPAGIGQAEQLTQNWVYIFLENGCFKSCINISFKDKDLVVVKFGLTVELSPLNFV
jgi:hypothetical protein